jgi:hypothetical protein
MRTLPSDYSSLRERWASLEPDPGMVDDNAAGGPRLEVPMSPAQPWDATSVFGLRGHLKLESKPREGSPPEAHFGYGLAETALVGAESADVFG